MELRFTTYRIRGTHHRTGQVIEGTTRWDGLSSMYAVETADGVQYLTVLDTLDIFEEASDEDVVHERLTQAYQVRIEQQLTEVKPAVIRGYNDPPSDEKHDRRAEVVSLIESVLEQLNEEDALSDLVPPDRHFEEWAEDLVIDAELDARDNGQKWSWQ